MAGAQDLADAIVLAINNAQPARAGGNHKLAKIHDPDPRAWALWVEDFHRVVEINDWTNTRARLELSTALQGKLKEAVYGIPTNHHPVPPAADAADYRQLLQLYQARIVPPNLAELYLDQFREAKQRPRETLVDFHRRLKYLFTTSHPGVADPENNGDLKRQFYQGLADKDIGLEVYRLRDAAAATYQGCLTVAQNYQIGLVRFKNRRDTEEEARQHQLQQQEGERAQGERALYAVRRDEGSADHSKKRCYQCKKMGHIARNCPARETERRRSRSRSPRRTSRGRGTSRGSASSRRRRSPSTGRRSSNKKLAHLEAGQDQEEEDQGNY